MREWVLQQGGLQSLWTALAWSLTQLPTHGIDIGLRRLSMQAVVTLLSPDRTVDFAALLPLPAVATVLRLLFSDFLPGDLAAGNAHKWALLPLVRATACVCTQPDGYMLRLLHRPVLIAWPHLMSALRQQQKSRAQTPQLPGPAEGVHAELKVTGLLRLAGPIIFMLMFTRAALILECAP